LSKPKEISFKILSPKLSVRSYSQLCTYPPSFIFLRLITHKLPCWQTLRQGDAADNIQVAAWCYAGGKQTDIFAALPGAKQQLNSPCNSPCVASRGPISM